MVQFFFRFVAGGAVVASVPLVAKHLGTQFAGLVLLVPVVTIIGFAFVYQSEGMSAMRSTVEGSLKALPILLIYLLAVYGASRMGLGIVASLSIGVATWAVVATLFMAAHWIA